MDWKQAPPWPLLKSVSTSRGNVAQFRGPILSMFTVWRTPEYFILVQDHGLLTEKLYFSTAPTCSKIFHLSSQILSKSIFARH